LLLSWSYAFELATMLTGGALIGLGAGCGWLLSRLISAWRRPAEPGQLLVCA